MMLEHHSGWSAMPQFSKKNHPHLHRVGCTPICPSTALQVNVTDPSYISDELSNPVTGPKGSNVVLSISLVFVGNLHFMK